MNTDPATVEAGRLARALISALPGFVNEQAEAGREEPDHPWKGAGSLSWNAVNRLRNLAAGARKALAEGKLVLSIVHTTQQYSHDTPRDHHTYHFIAPR